MIEYEILRIIWWLLLGVLLIGFAILDGFDLGVAALLPYVARDNQERRVMLNSIGSVWESNQVWFILGAGVIFVAWPILFAVLFSGFYLVMFLILLAFIIRPVGFDYREKINHPIWRSVWDTCLCLGGIIPSFCFGVIIGNLFTGVDFSFNNFLVMENQITLFSLFHPFSILCGLVSLSMIVCQGACYLNIKTDANVQDRAKKIMSLMPIITIVLFAIGGLIVNSLPTYIIQDFAGENAVSNPLAKTVIVQASGWLDNYDRFKFMIVAPIFGFLGAFLVLFLQKFPILAFISNSLSILGIIATAGLSLFPFLLPSRLNPNASLTIWDASSSKTTLLIMLIAVIIFLPIVLSYASWVYSVVRGKITKAFIKADSKTLY